jgi:hypothetical protein
MDCIHLVVDNELVNEIEQSTSFKIICSGNASNNIHVVMKIVSLLVNHREGVVLLDIKVILLLILLISQ